MRVQGLAIALRPRPSWEAVDLGVALVRQNARAVFGAWLLLTGTVFVLLHALLLPFGLGWLAALLLWWLKPAFDRIALLVLSRAVLGQRLRLRDTLRELRRGWRPLLPWLLWRRLHPLRSMLLPVDLLEGGHGAARAARVRVLAAGEGSTPLLLWLIGVHLELMLWASVIAFGLMLVPTEFLSDSARALLDLLAERPPWWLEAGGNLLYWLAMCAVEPFYVGAGFALYLNRRTQLEAWDIEFAFRRIAARLARAALVVLLLGSLLPLAPLASAAAPATVPAKSWNKAPDDARGPAGKSSWQKRDEDAPAPQAPDRAVTDATIDEDDDDAREDEAAAAPEQALADVLGEHAVPADAGFADAVRQSIDDPDLSPRQNVGHWRWRDRDPATPERPGALPDWAASVGNAVAWVIEHLGWILLALLLVLLLASHRRWRTWLFARTPPALPAAGPGEVQQLAAHAALPPDLGDAVLTLWRAGDARAALSLFYRGALAALTERLGVPLPPGATEDDGLRHARRLPSTPFVEVFRRIVRHWQAVAWAHRVPDDAELLALVAAWRALERPA